MICIGLHAHAATRVTAESLEMSIDRIAVHNGAGNLIDLQVRIEYREGMQQQDYPDFIVLRSDLQNWIASYNWEPIPGEPPVYWETMMKDLSTRVLQSYPTIRNCTLSINVYPKSNYNFLFEIFSTAKRSDEGEAAISTNESLAISLRSYGLDFQGPQVIDLTTTLHYKQGLGIRDYPTLRLIQERIISGVENYPVKTDYWETMIKAVSSDILEEFSAYAAVDIHLNVYPTSSVAYFHQVNCTTVRD